MSFDFTQLAATPGVAPHWTGFPEFNFIGGHNDEASVPVPAFRKALDDVLAREGHTLGTYFLQSGPQGYRPLREYLVAKQQKYAGITCNPDEILITSGSLQAMDLVNHALVSAGDTVIVEQSNYGGTFPKLEKIGANIVTVPVGADGMDIDALEKVLVQMKSDGVQAKFIYTIPTVHNPTGTIMPLDARKRLVALAQAHKTPIFEDECYADLVWSGTRPPSLHALDDLGLTIHIGSFSKNIAPALRVGYIIAPWGILSRMIPLKTDAGSGALEQMALAEFCPHHFDAHLAALNATLETKLDNLTEALDQHFGTAAHYTRPPGGIFLWVQLAPGVDTARLAEVALAEGVALNPGHEWYRGADAGRWLRLCFANPSHEVTQAGIARLAAICHREFGTPEVAANQRL